VEEERLTGRLFDTQQWVNEFEVMLRAMWEVAAANDGGGGGWSGVGAESNGKPLPNIVMAGYTGWRSR